MTKRPMTPMLVQYLVGLCAAKWDRDAVEVTVGDWVTDTAAGKKRDVDVTVTVTDIDEGSFAFKAYEVKDEGTSLDVAEVEQLCLKFNDMPTVTHRAIVSTSGFSEAAQKKASAHGVDLYQLIPWEKPLEEQFPILAPMKGTPQECFPSRQLLLTWSQWGINVVAPTAKGDFQVRNDGPVFDENGSIHGVFKTFERYVNEILLRSTGILCTMEHPTKMLMTFPVPFSSADDFDAPVWPHTHTLDTRGDDVYVKVGKRFCRIETITVNGMLQWQRGPASLYYVMSSVHDGEAFAAALVTIAGKTAK